MPLLELVPSDFGDIRVTRDAQSGATAYYQNGCYHSQADRRGFSLCTYIHAMNEIIRQRRARNVLIVGCAGGTLATMLRRLKCRVTVVDIDPAAFVIARRHFHLPSDVRCVRRDGVAFLRAARKTYDAIVVDVFDTDNNVPRAFTHAGFFGLVRAAMTAGGTLIMNIITAHDGDRRADLIAKNAQAAGFEVGLFDWPEEEDRNTLLVSGPTRRLRLPSGHEPDDIAEELALMSWRRLHRRA
jgi:spermidine synthase